MSRFKAYIKPFDTNGDYVDDYIDVTGDVDFNSFSTLSQKIDNSSYNVGIFNFNSINLKLRNEHGHYEDVNTPNTIFSFKRTDSKFKLTWSIGDDITQCGNAICGAVPANLEVDVYKGLLNDESFASDISNQKVTFKVLGLESILRRVDVEDVTITAGQTFSTILLNVLNQTPITDLLTVSGANISVGTDQVIDSAADFTGKTVKESLDELLKLSNAILYIENDVIIITPRVESATLDYTFFGQASVNGTESIQNLSAIKSGLDRTFNFWQWQDTPLSPVIDPSSKTTYGVRKNSISGGSITDSGKRTAILTNLKDEFKNPKREFDLTTILDYTTLELFILNKVQVDYPTPYSPPEGDITPLFGVAIFGISRFPYGEFGITISEDDRFKIMGRKINIKDQLITFSLREI